MRLNKCLYLLLLILGPLTGWTQSDTLQFKNGRNYRIYLNNGENLSGFVVEQNADFIAVESRPLLIHREIRRSTIVAYEKISLRESFAEDALGENPHSDMYLTVASALPFEPQTLRSTGHWLIFDNTEYAFGEHWALHMSSLTFYPSALGLKCSYELSEMNYIGANVNAMAWWGNSDGGGGLLGIFSQAKYTHGNSNRNFTIGAGFLSMNSELMGIYNSRTLLVHMPMVSAGFRNRFASRWAVVADGHMLPDEGIMLGGLGLKFLRDEFSAWSFGAYKFVNGFNNPFYPNFSAFSIPLPYLSYTRVLD